MVIDVDFNAILWWFMACGDVWWFEHEQWNDSQQKVEM